MGYQSNLEDFRSIDLKTIRPPNFLRDFTEKIKNKHANVKSGWKEVNTCPVCQSSDRKTEFTKFDIAIARCLNCTLRYTTLVPETTDDIYSDTSYLSYARGSYQSNRKYRQNRFGTERLEILRSLLGNLEGRRLLDAGCGTGWFLELARENGMKIHGQEIAKGLAKWTSDEFGIRIFDCPLEEIEAKAFYDAITMFDLLEHVPDPVGLMNRAKRLMADNGVILVFTPNFDSLGISVMGKESNLIVPAEHLTYFNDKSIRVLAEKVEMRIDYFSTNGIDLGDLKGYYEYQGDNTLSAACEALYDRIQPVVDAAGAGNHLRCSFRKEEQVQER